MAINNVNTTSEEKSYKFLKNQSSILRTVSTNNITINGVNVIVAKPKVGDIMCVTRYKNNSDVLLPAEEQKVIWIDGLSIEPKQLSTEFEPVGICVVVNGDKAIVRYKKEFDNFKWSASNRLEIDFRHIEGLLSKTLIIPIEIKKRGINTAIASGQLSLSDWNGNRQNDRKQYFVEQLNAWFENVQVDDFSAELVQLDTDLPSSDTRDWDDEGNFIDHRIIINIKFTDSSSYLKTIIIGSTSTDSTTYITYAIGKHIKAIDFYYNNNGFIRNYNNGCCRAQYYEYVQNEQYEPSEEVPDINTIPNVNNYDEFTILPANSDDFKNNPKCQLLRDTFATYDEYFDSLMIMCPCGAGGTIAENQSGKENTYKLTDCKYSGTRGEEEFLYPAAHKAASIDVNGPKLTAGNWWLPSSAEMVQMMRDITYNTSFWYSKPDIVNRVIDKIKKVDDNWVYLSANMNRWTSSRYSENGVYTYGGDGSLGETVFYVNVNIMATPITIYEF